MWLLNQGSFDEAGFQIDHIIEVKHGGTNDPSNLQALCPSCHAVKTKRCAQQKWDFTSAEIDAGRAYIDIDTVIETGAPIKKRKCDVKSMEF